VLTEMASGDSGTASDSSNIGSTVGSFVGGAIGSFAGPVGAVQCAALGASIGGAIAGYCEMNYSILNHVSTTNFNVLPMSPFAIIQVVIAI